ncbi:proline--tRNA ligase [Holzapfeliella floricola]|uniref:Proline--tRNA ligase n=1 Tax=Holzapfeliella floricola DSM 23037 = JCM 16512 TaxID=1423744 RepID=A0A0R2DSC6_9LACO|nr:proline--tRNA ligase [Holzapfeliella floricola]KRN03799.1 proline--tRNA ligase [Holzapfeliella floricola DSM 23037 = JCM 16512]
MKQSKFFMPTLKETPSDAEAVSHQLMLRGGYVRQVTAGVYSYLPLANRVLSKVSQIIREEMEAIDSSEMMMPELLPASLWQKSGRYDSYGPNLFKLKDRHERDFILGPTHEETFTEIVAQEIKSYKRLPFSLFQIQTKFRDENRPRFGLLRGREFIMKDGYSFASNYEQLDQQYEDMKNAYLKIFARTGVEVKPIIGDAGAMGGSDSLEFGAPAAIGEDTIVYTDSGYAANIEMASSYFVKEENNAPLQDVEKVATPNIKTIADLADFLKISEKDIVKSVVYIADETPVLVLIRGDQEVNEVKLKNLLQVEDLRLATNDEQFELTQVKAGSIGPVGQNFAKEVIADCNVQNMANFVVGANETGFQLKNINLNRDFTPDNFADITVVKEGELDPTGKAELKFTRGIEIGHIFKLGTRYSEAMNAKFLDENGKAQPVIMGSYGIGVSRLLSAIIEQHHDDRGILWPKEVAPFEVHLIQMKMNNDEQTQISEKMYQDLQSKFEVLYDDRAERPGVKFADADLLGAPFRVIIGKKAAEGIVEVKNNQTKEAVELQISEVANYLKNEIG